MATKLKWESTPVDRDKIRWEEARGCEATTNGKGSDQRPTNLSVYSINHEKIFGKKK